MDSTIPQSFILIALHLIGFCISGILYNHLKIKVDSSLNRLEILRKNINRCEVEIKDKIHNVRMEAGSRHSSLIKLIQALTIDLDMFNIDLKSIDSKLDEIDKKCSYIPPIKVTDLVSLKQAFELNQELFCNDKGLTIRFHNDEYQVLYKNDVLQSFTSLVQLISETKLNLYEFETRKR